MRQRGVECEEVNMKRTYVRVGRDRLWNVRVPKRIKRSEKRFAAAYGTAPRWPGPAHTDRLTRPPLTSLRHPSCVNCYGCNTVPWDCVEPWHPASNTLCCESTRIQLGYTGTVWDITSFTRSAKLAGMQGIACSTGHAGL